MNKCASCQYTRTIHQHYWTISGAIIECYHPNNKNAFPHYGGKGLESLKIQDPSPPRWCQLQKGKNNE